MIQDDLRTEFYRLKAALFDPNTDLQGVPLVHDTVRALFDLARWIGVIHIEIDSLGQVETIYGWQTLDRILRLVSSVLVDARQEVLPRETILAQTGIYDGRFVAFLPLASPSIAPTEALDKAASALGTRLRERFTSADFDSMAPPLKARMGYAVFVNQPFCRLERVIYRAIEEARRQSLAAAPQEKSREQAELRRIILDADIEVLFQPVLDMTTSVIVGYEALSRGPSRSTLERPLALFACSEEAGLSKELDMLCQRRALDGSRGLPSGRKLFLNALPGSLLDPGFRDHLLVDLPSGLSLKPNDIVLEITERNAIGDYEEFGHEIGELRTHGFLIGVDDVGTGSSSLQTIAEVRPDYIKVDGTLIRHIEDNLVKQEMLRSLSQVARSIKASVVAEGIEHEAELRTVKECGVHLGQGYLFARPGRDLAAELGDC